MGCPEDAWARVVGYPGPMALAIGGMESPEDWEKLAQLCLTYSDAPGLNSGPIEPGHGVQIRTKENFRKWLITSIAARG